MHTTVTYCIVTTTDTTVPIYDVSKVRSLPIPLQRHQRERGPREDGKEGKRNGSLSLVPLTSRRSEARFTPLVGEETETCKPESRPNSGKDEIGADQLFTKPSAVDKRVVVVHRDEEDTRN